MSFGDFILEDYVKRDFVLKGFFPRDCVQRDFVTRDSGLIPFEQVPQDIYL